MGTEDENSVRAVFIQQDNIRTNISGFLYSTTNGIISHDDSHFFQPRPIHVTAGSAAFVATPIYRESASTHFSPRYGI